MLLTKILVDSALPKSFINVLLRRQMSKSPVEGKVAVITGGAKGIGLACAKGILQCCGRGVMIGDIDEKAGQEAICELIKKYGENKACFLKTDVTKKADNENLFKAAKEKFHQIDLVINSAGILQDKNWEQEIAVNVSGLVHGTFLGFEHMGCHKQGKGGVIINLSSIYGLQQAHACPVYNGTKYFGLGFSRAMGHEYYEKLTGVKVLTMCPGITITDMINEAEKYSLEGFGDINKVLKEELACSPSQPPEACASCLTRMLCDGENGGVWVVEKSECYKIKLPDRKKLRVKEDC